MRSIRSSLLIYLLPLFALAVGLSLSLLYENQRDRDARIYAGIEANLAKTNELNRSLQEERYQKDRDAMEIYFDESLRLNASILSREVTQTVHSRQNDPRYAALHVIGFQDLLLGMPVNPMLMTFRDSQTANGAAFVIRMYQPPPLNLKLFEGIFSARDTHDEYYQISDQQGRVFLQSPNLKPSLIDMPSGAVLPTPAGAWTAKILEPTYSDEELPSGVKVRQVTVRVPVVQYKQEWGVGPPRGGPGFRYPGWGGPSSISFSASDKAAIEAPNSRVPVVLFHYARPESELKNIYAAFQQSLNASRQQTEKNNAEMLAAQAKTSQDSLASLRWWVTGITAVAILAVLLGIVALVNLGLRPVKRITDAVSQVNERDFQLRLKEEEVPVELLPIVSKLKDSLQSLENAFEREKQAAADISHELRTPIAALLATAQVCLRKPRSSDEYRQALANCVEIGQQLNILVERLLTLARIDSGTDPIQPEAVDVPEVAQQCVNMVRPLAEAHGLQLNLERNGGAVTSTDPNKLREIVINLLHNAIQYNKPNGSIDVAVHRNNGHVYLEVRDTGMGIPVAAREHLFERFYRVDPSRHSDTVHAGLGLAIVKGYVDLMGGHIEVDSVEGEGSTFRIILPAATAA